MKKPATSFSSFDPIFVMLAILERFFQIFLKLPMNYQIYFEKPFFYWLTLKKLKDYAKFCPIKLFESTFYRLQNNYAGSEIQT